ncbi:MAG: hypothetical protein ACQERR_10330 [Pseudomonadota bacterium]
MNLPPPLFFRYLLAWLPMVPLAILNGTLREFTYGRVLAESTAHQLSTVTLVLLFTLYARLLDARWPLTSRALAIGVGGIWLVLTVAFEFGLGRLGGRSWEELFRAYDILSGNLWLLVPVAVAVLPMVMHLRHRSLPRGP